MTSKLLRAALLVLASLVASSFNSSALAATEDYEFQLIETNIKQGEGAVVAVRLLDKRSGKPVPDAVILPPGSTWCRTAWR